MTETSNLDRIKDDLRYWASLTEHRMGTGFPKKVSWYNERVQSSASQEAYTPKELPPKIQALEDFLATYEDLHVSIVVLEYTDRRPQKAKADALKITREKYNQKLSFMHEELAAKMYGKSDKVWHKIDVVNLCHS